MDNSLLQITEIEFRILDKLPKSSDSNATKRTLYLFTNFTYSEFNLD